MNIKLCPFCRKNKPSSEKGIWPFCSARCKNADLGCWASEQYRVPEKIIEQEEPAVASSQPTQSRAEQELAKCNPEHILSGERVLNHSDVDEIKRISSLPAIDKRIRNKG